MDQDGIRLDWKEEHWVVVYNKMKYHVWYSSKENIINVDDEFGYPVQGTDEEQDVVTFFRIELAKREGREYP